MATIYAKTGTDKTCILSPREYFMRPFDFQAWTETRFGLYMDGVAASDDNTDSSAEAVATGSAADLIAIGMKDSATTNLPGVAGGLFLGVRNESTQSAGISGTSIQSNNNLSLAACGFNGATLVAGTSSDRVDALQFPSASPATGYNGFWAIKFVITNLGAATQSVAISTTATTPIAGTDYSASALRTLINNGTYSTPRTVAWNSGGVALDIPDAIFIRLPFYSNRIRISCMRAIRYAP